jgi:hypothetical protein
MRKMTGWVVLTFLALVTGLGALRYALPHVLYPAPLPNFFERRDWLIAMQYSLQLRLSSAPGNFFPA